MNEDYLTLREDNRRKAEHEAELQVQKAHTEAIKSLEQRMGTAFSALLKYLDGKTTKTEVVNQLKDIGTPDAFKVMSAVNDMHATLKKLKNTDITPLTNVMADMLAEVQQIPKENAEAPEEVSINNLPDFEAYTKRVEDAIKSIDTKPVVNLPAPQVKVDAPVVQVEAPDFATLEKSIKDVVKAVQNQVFPEQKETNIAPIVKEQKKSNELLQKIVDKPMGGGGSGGHTTPYQDNTGKPTYITLVDGKVPVSLTSASDPSSFYVYDIEEGTTSYYGNTNVAGAWMVKKVTDTLVSYATVTNNGSVTTYTDAWTSRASLTFGRIDEAF